MQTVSQKIVQSQYEQPLTPKEWIKKFLTTLNEKKQSISCMQLYCEKMWAHEERNGTSAVFLDRLVSLLRDMKKYPDLRIACFDLITEEAEDYQDIFPMFFQAQSLANKSIQNPFATDSNYKYLKGNPANGIVVLYPQSHKVKDEESNIKDGNDIYESQLGIYRDFLIQKPEHVYLEGITPSEAAMLNTYESSNCSTLPKMDTLSSIADAINSDQELGGKEKEILMRLGGALVYAATSQRSATPATLYATMGEHEEDIIASMSKGKRFLSELSDKDQFYVMYEREANVAHIVNTTADQRKGKPAFVVMGRAHQFENVFLEENSPAVYRKEFRPFDYESF